MSPKDSFLTSLARCQARPRFIPEFYGRFLASSPEVAAKFRFTDFTRQQHMLLRSLELCAAATAGNPDGLAELTARADTHSRAHLNIEPQLYDLWLQAAIETASECDPDWNGEIEAAWRTIVHFAIHHMTMRYDPLRHP
jgi:hemoglobin-like flavoprotein